jgi:hypothetical protein
VVIGRLVMPTSLTSTVGMVVAVMSTEPLLS